MVKRQYSDRELSDFCTGLGHLLHAGVSTGDALVLLADDTDGQGLFACLPVMGHLADAGTPLSRILEETGGFPAYIRTLIRTGEETGHLEDALLSLGAYYDQQERLDRELRAALTYPLLLLGILLAVLGALLVWVLPVFDEVYRQLGSSLNGFAGVLLALGGLLKRFSPVLLVVFALGIAGLAHLHRTQGSGLWLLNKWNSSPGSLLAQSRLAGVLAMGLRSGLDQEQALLLAEGLSTESGSLHAHWSDCLTRLRGQDSLSAALRESGLLPAAESRLLEAGVRSGCTDTVMDAIAQRLQERGFAQLEAKLSRIEPSLVLFAGILAGSVLLCVLLPLTQIMAAIG